MLPILNAVLIVALNWIFLSNVYSQSTGCGHVNADLQNTNATGAWPWMVAITERDENGKYSIRCNGFLIDRRHALTAASCFDSNYDVTDFLIRIGEKNWNEGEAYKISSIIKHPRYERCLYYDDIAILKLYRDVDTPNYAPICLADDKLSLDGVEVVKTAWGTVEPGGSISGTMIENVGLRIISNRDCNRMFRQLGGSFFRRLFPGGLNFGTVCTENPTKQTESCEGSSGAPLMYRNDSKNWIAVGISSFGLSCGTDAPSGFTRVSAYLDWITENTRDDEGWIIENTREDKDCGHVNTDLQSTNKEGAWPWMVAITVKEKGGKYGLLCNGFLIDQRHVLTTATCFASNYDARAFLIRIGKKNWDEGESYKVICIKKHPRFERRQFYDDIAIITLSRNVDSSNYAPICIPDDDLRIKDMRGVEVTKIAWGAITRGGTVSRTLIQIEGLRIMSNKDCHETFEKLQGDRYFKDLRGGVSSDMVCTENPTNQAEFCEGDGGAPVMYKDESNKWVAVGITSFGLSCGIAPTVYTKVSYYLEWIKENTIDDKGNCSSDRISLHL